MEDQILVGRGRRIIQASAGAWKQSLAEVPQHSQPRLSFMTDSHHRVRYFVVKAMADTQQPITPEFIAEELHMPPELVKSILDELEKNLFFVVRDDRGAVTWAYPVTVETTPHTMVFSSGERLYGA